MKDSGVLTGLEIGRPSSSPCISEPPMKEPPNTKSPTLPTGL